LPRTAEIRDVAEVGLLSELRNLHFIATSDIAQLGSSSWCLREKRPWGAKVILTFLP